MMTTEEMITYDMIVEYGIATPDELNLAFNMTNMGWKETLDRVVDIRTGYPTLDTYLMDEMEEE